MNASLSFGTPNTEWSQCGLYQMPLIFNECDVDYKAIIHENQLVAKLSYSYMLTLAIVLLGYTVSEYFSGSGALSAYFSG